MIDFAIVDSHVHLLDPSRLSYSWAAGAPKLARAFNFDDLLSVAKPYEIAAAVFVEVDVDPGQHRAEAAYAAEEPRLTGAVVSLPLERGAAMEAEMAEVAALGRTRGVRRLLQNKPSGFALQPAFVEAVRLLPRYRLSFDICIYWPQMLEALELVRRCPDVSFVLDHFGKPGVAAGVFEPWAGWIADMAREPNVACKLSGLTTEADPRAWTPAQLRRYIDHAAQAFGPDRLLYGGDWPVCTLAGDYLQWLATLDQATADWTSDERRKLFADNAKRFYRL